jgi:hypothetical protein
MTGGQIEVLTLEAGKMLVLEHLHDRLERFVRDSEALFLAHAEGFDHVRRGAAAKTEVHAAVAQNVSSRNPFGQHVRIVGRQQHDRKAKPDARGALADRRMKQIRTRAVSDLLEEMHFGQPIVVKARGIAGDSLIDRIAVGRQLGLRLPGLGYLQLSHETEFHRSTSGKTALASQV